MKRFGYEVSRKNNKVMVFGNERSVDVHTERRSSKVVEKIYISSITSFILAPVRHINFG